MKNEITLVRRNSVPMVSSKEVAGHFGKEHSNLLKAYRNLDCVKNHSDFAEVNFELCETITYSEAGMRYVDKTLYMTRDGFSLLAFGFTGKRAEEWKIKYIGSFNSMEQAVLETIPGLQKQIKILRNENLHLIDKIRSHRARKALPGPRSGMVQVPIEVENIFGDVDQQWVMVKAEEATQMQRMLGKRNHMLNVVEGMNKRLAAIEEELRHRGEARR